MALSDIFDSGLLRPRNLVPAGLALLVGVVAWFGIRPALSGAGEEPTSPVVTESVPAPSEMPPVEPEPEPVYPFVLVAKRNVQPGVLLVAELVDWLEWRDPIDINLAVVQDTVALEVVLGAVTTRPFREGEMIAWDGLILPGSPGFITGVLQPGYRAVTVEVDRATTSAHIIYPGDRVDVIMVANVEAGEQSPGGGPSARSIVHDVRVLAVGSTIMSLGRYGKAQLSAPGVLEGVVPPQGETYTLEVAPKDAKRLSLATNTGRLTLAIRPFFASPGAPRDTAPVHLEEVLVPPSIPVPPRVRVIRGGVEDEIVSLEELVSLEGT